MVCQSPKHGSAMKTWKSEGDPREEGQATNYLDWGRVMQVEAPEKQPQRRSCVTVGSLGKALGDTPQRGKEIELGKRKR